MNLISELRELLSESELRHYHMDRMFLFLMAEEDEGVKAMAEEYFLSHLPDKVTLPHYTSLNQYHLGLETVLRLLDRAGEPFEVNGSVTRFTLESYDPENILFRESSAREKVMGVPESEVKSIFIPRMFRWTRIKETKDKVSFVKNLKMSLSDSFNVTPVAARTAMTLSILGQLDETDYPPPECVELLKEHAAEYKEWFPHKDLLWGDKLILEL